MRLMGMMAAACCLAAAPCGATVMASEAYGTSTTLAAGNALAAALVAGQAAGQGEHGYSVAGGVASVRQGAALTGNLLFAASNTLAAGLVTTGASAAPGQAAHASATVGDLSLGLANQLLGTLSLTGLLGIGVDAITSTSDAVVGADGQVATSGGTVLSGLSLTGSLLSGLLGADVAVAPAANTVLLSVAGLTVTLNEQVRTQAADGTTSFATNGLHLAFRDYALDDGRVNGDVVVAHSAVSVAAVPEPASWLLMVAGFGAAGLALRLARVKPGPARA